MRKFGTALLAIAVIFAVSACGGNNNGADNNTASPSPTQTQTPGGSPAGTPPGNAAGTVDATALYQQNCLACHAADMSGGMGPELQTVGSRLQQDQIADIIAQGQGRMPAFAGTLSDADIQALAAWLATQKG